MDPLANLRHFEFSQGVSDNPDLILARRLQVIDRQRQIEPNLVTGHGQDLYVQVQPRESATGPATPTTTR